MKKRKSSGPHYNLSLLWLELRVPLLLLWTILLGGTLGYRLLYPHESWHRLFYMTAITLSTVGFGDILATDTRVLTAVYTISLMLVSMVASVYSASRLTAFFVEGGLGQLLQNSSIRRKVAKMWDHYIICGGGTTGVHVIREMERCRVPFVLLDQSSERLNDLREEFPRLLGIVGDASQEDVLEEAGIMSARGLVAALTNDKDNLFLTLTARQLNAELKIVSKAVDMNISRRLTIAGANYIVSPYYIGGMRMASEILRPNVVSFLDRMLRGQQNDIRIQEAVVAPDSPAVGRSLAELGIFAHTGVRVLAIQPPEPAADYLYNPDDGYALEAGTVLLFIGSTEQHNRLQKLLR